jgi:NodT family efflux transporter outer membrane factor (OMF) lipoprotein
MNENGRTNTVLFALLLTALVTALMGCTVGPHYRAPAPPSFATYTPEPHPTSTVSSLGIGGAPQRFKPSSDIPTQWWTLYNSPQLDRMVREALDNSPTLSQATARLKQAQEESNANTGATKYPSVSGTVSVQEEQVNLASFGVPFPNPPPFSLVNGSVAVSYALDLFGRNRRLIEGLNAQVEYQQWELEGARLMLAGNVVSAAIRQAQVRSQIAITRQMLALREHTVRISEQRYAAGGISEYDVHSQRTALSQVQALLPPLEQQIDSVNHQLAVLLGKTPGEARVEEVNLESLHLPEELPLSLPSSLVRQRPDIRAAEALLHQASANVGLATANLYPQIVLSGSAGAIGTSFTNGGSVWNVGASLTQPIFNGGSLRAEKRKAIAAYDEASSSYKETVLQVFREVADVLRSIDHDAQALQARSEAAAQAEGAYQIAAERYGAGGISQLALLDAQRQFLQTALDRVVYQASRYSDSATLFQALGGGWWNEHQGGEPKPAP